MFLEIDGLNVFYERKTGEGTPVLLLHGWGCGASTMRPIFECFAALGRDVTAIDFPGFGRSDSPPDNFTVFDYSRLTGRLIDELGLQNPDIIAHSFGGRVAIILAAENRVNRLLLVDAAGLKPRRGIKYYFKVGVYKLKRRLGVKQKNVGSADYRALSPSMQRVFVSVVNEHLDGLLPDVACPVLLIWGERDKDTPIRMARKMHKNIPDSGLIIFENCGHFAFIDDTPRFCRIAAQFFKESV